MRVDVMLDRMTEMRARLGLPTPCADCADPGAREYCGRCVRVLAEYLGMGEDHTRQIYGQKRSKGGDA